MYQEYLREQTDMALEIATITGALEPGEDEEELGAEDEEDEVVVLGAYTGGRGG